MTLLKAIAAILGGTSALYAVVGGLDVVEKSAWRDAPARVVAVKTECMMTPVGSEAARDIATIPCEQVERTRSRNPDVQWTVDEQVVATLELGGDVKKSKAEMRAPVWDGQVLRTGDRFVVLQNPENPRDVEKASDHTQAVMRTFGAAAFAGLCLVFIFSRPRSKTVKERGPHQQSAEIEDATAADGFIAEALARRAAAGRREMPAAASRSPQSGAGRPIFGRRIG